MNKSRIEYCDHTWNPITGCHHDCDYCYARKMTVRFSGNVNINKMDKKQYTMEDTLYVLEDRFFNGDGQPLNYPFGFSPTLHKNRFNELNKIKMGNIILVGSMADMFGDWVADSYIREIFISCKNHKQHNYLFLTKNPERYRRLSSSKILPEENNFWYGRSVTCKKDSLEVPVKGYTFLCIEPILEEIDLPAGSKRMADWIIIGAETGNRKGKVIPKKSWVDKIVHYADAVGIPVFMRDSLRPIMRKDEMRCDYPKILAVKKLSLKMEERMEGDCVICHKHLAKNKMITLSARSRRGEMTKQVAHVCHECFFKLCNEWNVDTPKFRKFLPMNCHKNG